MQRFSEVVPPPSLSNYIVTDTVKKKEPSLNINALSVLKYLIMAGIILLALNILVILSFQLDFDLPGKTKFYFDREGNLPTYFSTFILLLSAALLAFIGALKKLQTNKYTRHWIGLAIIFFALSLDESVSLHENLIEPLRQQFQLSGFLRFPWVILGGVFLVIFGISYLKFFMALSKTMKILFFISGAVYVLGAIGFEMIGGYLYVDFDDFSEKSLPYMVVMTIEETLEMSGILIFIYTLLRYIKTTAPKFKLNIQ